MPMAKDFVNDDGDRLNDEAQAQIEATLFKQGQDYADRNKRSKQENKGRAESRAKIKELGMDPNAYATAVRLIKDKTHSEIQSWMRDLNLTLKVMGSKQKELFPEEQLKAEARIQRAKEKAAGEPRSAAELNNKTDTDPKSDPKAGGAQIDLKEGIAETATFNDGAGKPTIEEREAAEGEAVLASKSDAWRGGFNAVAAGGQRGDNPFTEGSSEARDWFRGFESASVSEFDAAQPAANETPPKVTAAAPKRQPAKSQSAKAAEKLKAASLN